MEAWRGGTTVLADGGPDAGGGPVRNSSVTSVAEVKADSALYSTTVETKAEGHGATVVDYDIVEVDGDDQDEDEEVPCTDFAQLAQEPFETVFAQPPSPRVQEEDHLILRNLDTGEVRRLGEGALSQSFVGEHVRPDRLECAASLQGRNTNAWSTWWADKRRRDERVWSAAESGCIESISAALQPPTDGGPPAEVNSRSLYGRTALHIAASVGRPECVEAVLDASAHVDARTDAGLTALHIASQRGHKEVAQLLIDWSAEIICEADDGNLPLHLASSCGHASTVSLLLVCGGEDQLDHRNHLRQRPIEVARDIDVAVIFQRHESSRGRSDSEDHYAGRTPFLEGTVLLHNARSDMVRRLMDRAKQAPTVEELPSMEEQETQGRNGRTVRFGSRDSTASPDMSAGATPVDPASEEASPTTRSWGTSPGSTPLGSNPVDPSQGENTTRRSFVRLRPTGSGIEQVGPDSFVLVRQLGRGSFGEVFQVKHRKTEVEYAMKIMHKNKISRGNLLRYARTERNVLSYIRHPYIVSLHYAFQTTSHLVLVLHFCPGGNMQQLITSHRRLQEPLARLFSAEILTALSHLHERSIVFRDLKPENVVIDADGHSMLTDFGLSREGVRGFRGARSFCGSLAFLAPEILQQRGHGHPVDVYGLGVLMFAMLTGMPPFYHRDRDTLFANIRHAPLQIPNYVSRTAASLIEALMEREPSRRLGASKTSDACSHPFFAQLDWEALARREIPVPQSTEPQSPAPERRQASTDAVGNPFAPQGWRWPGSPNITNSNNGEVEGWNYWNGLAR